MKQVQLYSCNYEPVGFNIRKREIQLPYICDSLSDLQSCYKKSICQY